MNIEYAQNHFGLGTKPKDKVSLDTLFDLGKANSVDFANQFDLQTSREIIIKHGEYQKAKKQKADDFELVRKLFGREYDKSLEARAIIAINSNSHFYERLVWFWANHFAVSADNIFIRSLAGSYEFEAIRPNINGKFQNLLYAAITHPAMLLYLNQVRSVGPNSKFAQMKNNQDDKTGLNENLAREILELHTLGVHGGYTQTDVTEFAKAMTGLTVMTEQRKKRKFAPQNIEIGQSYFEPAIHEPGSFKILGETYSGEKAFFDFIIKISTHKSTATHISTKLARHFAGDEPPKSLISKLEAAFLSSDGDLRELYKILINAPECAAPSALKFKNPWEWLISALRLSSNPKVQEINLDNVLKDLGMGVWRPQSPKGFDDIEDAWAAPNSLVHRVETANIIASNFEFPLPPIDLAKAAIGANISQNTLNVIARAESQMVGYALLMLSPEFLRR